MNAKSLGRLVNIHVFCQANTKLSGFAVKSNFG